MYLHIYFSVFIDRIELIQGNDIFKIIKEDKYKLAIKKKLDFEVQSAYHLKLRYGFIWNVTSILSKNLSKNFKFDFYFRLFKQNGDSIETLVNVDITDGNEHEPNFDKLSYAVSLSESLSVGSSVMTVKATDKDKGKNADLVYSIYEKKSSGINNIFKIRSIV